MVSIPSLASAAPEVLPADLSVALGPTAGALARATALMGAVALVFSSGGPAAEQRNTAAIGSLALFLIVKSGPRAVAALSAPQPAAHGPRPVSLAGATAVLPGGQAGAAAPPFLLRQPHAATAAPLGMAPVVAYPPGAAARGAVRPSRVAPSWATDGIPVLSRHATEEHRSIRFPSAPRPQVALPARGGYFPAASYTPAAHPMTAFPRGAPLLGYGAMPPGAAFAAAGGGAGGHHPLARRGPGVVVAAPAPHFSLQPAQPPPYYDTMQRQLVSGARACAPPRSASSGLSRTLERALSRVRSRGGSRNVGFSFKCGPALRPSLAPRSARVAPPAPALVFHPGSAAGGHLLLLHLRQIRSVG